MRILLLLLVIAILNTTCKKSSDLIPHKNTLSASVNGVPFNAASIGVYISGSYVPGAKAVIILPRDTEPQLWLNLYNYDGHKSIFTLDTIPAQSWGAYCLENCSSVGALLSNSYSGELKIDSFNKTIKDEKEGEIITGTFHFESDGDAGKQSITNGHFSLFVPIN